MNASTSPRVRGRLVPGAFAVFALLGAMVPRPARADDDLDRAPPPAVRLVWFWDAPVAIDLRGDRAVSPAARELVTRDAYPAIALWREHPGLRSSVVVSAPLLLQATRYALDRLLPFLDRSRDRIDAAAYLERWRGRTDPLIDLALAPALLGASDAEPLLEAALVTPADVARRFPELVGLRGRTPSAWSDDERLDVVCWALLAALPERALEQRVQLASGSFLDLRDLVERRASGTYWRRREFTVDDANRLVAETAKVLEGFLAALRSLRRSTDGSRGQLELLATPLSASPLPSVLDAPADALARVRLGLDVFERALGSAPDGVAVVGAASEEDERLLRSLRDAPVDGPAAFVAALVERARRGGGDGVEVPVVIVSGDDLAAAVRMELGARRTLKRVAERLDAAQREGRIDLALPSAAVEEAARRAPERLGVHEVVHGARVERLAALRRALGPDTAPLEALRAWLRSSAPLPEELVGWMEVLLAVPSP